MGQEIAAIVDMGALAAAMVATGEATKYKIDEAIGDYDQAILDIDAQIDETELERDRKLGQLDYNYRFALEGGEAALGEKSAAAKYDTRMAMTKAEMIASSAENALGSSGVRASGSPLLAAQQQVDLAFAAADRTAEAGSAGVKLGGLALGKQLTSIEHGRQDVRAQSSLLTSEFGRRRAGNVRKKTELEENRGKMIAWAYAGGAPALTSSFYNASKTFNWWGN